MKPPASATGPEILPTAEDAAVSALAKSPGDVEADPYSMTFALMGLARAREGSGDQEAALIAFRLAVRVARKVANEHLRCLAAMRTAVLRGKLGDAEPARATPEELYRIGQGLGD